MDRDVGNALREAFLEEIRAWQRAVVTAQAEFLTGRQRTGGSVAAEYAPRPPGWSLGACLPPSREARERAERLLQSHPSPIPGAVRRLHQSERQCDRRFLRLLWEDRPMLVAAVALYSRLSDFDLHPDLYRRLMVEPAFRSATETTPLTDDFVQMTRRYSTRRERLGDLNRYLQQLESLGWSGWRVPEGETEPIAPKGGGEPMPCWSYATHPAKLDGQPPDDLAAWWTVEASGEERKGRTLYSHAVEAILEALDLRNKRNDVENREKLAEHLPEVFAELRDPAPGGPLKLTIGNIQSR